MTVWLSTGTHQSYDVGRYVKNLGDRYTFTATFGGYRVDVTTKVVDQDGKAECQAALANLFRN